MTNQHPTAAEQWTTIDTVGGYVCAHPDPTRPGRICGTPVETEPCDQHPGAGRSRDLDPTGLAWETAGHAAQMRAERDQALAQLERLATAGEAYLTTECDPATGAALRRALGDELISAWLLLRPSDPDSSDAGPTATLPAEPAPAKGKDTPVVRNVNVRNVATAITWAVRRYTPDGETPVQYTRTEEDAHRRAREWHQQTYRHADVLRYTDTTDVTATYPTHRNQEDTDA